MRWKLSGFMMYKWQSSLYDSTALLLWHMQDFLRNNRGINDGGDLPEDYMSSLYERIQTNEIKMKVSIAINKTPERTVFKLLMHARAPDVNRSSAPAHCCCAYIGSSHVVIVHKSSVGHLKLTPLCRSLGLIQPVWRQVGPHRQQGREEEGGWTPSSTSFLAASRRPPTNPTRMPSSALMTTSGQLYCCVIQKENCMCQNDAITAKQSGCCLSCITHAATVADSLIQHSSTDPDHMREARLAC